MRRVGYNFVPLSLTDGVPNCTKRPSPKASVVEMTPPHRLSQQELSLGFGYV